MEKTIRGIGINEIADTALRWATYALPTYPRWELNELHNEAFIASVRLVEKGEYDSAKSKLITFLSHALPFAVRKQYRQMNGERRLVNNEGKQVYQRKEHFNNELLERTESKHNTNMVIIEVKPSNDWAQARMAGFTATELRKRGMTFEQQKKEAEEFRNDQRKSKR